jgi:hypothetical protein
MRSRSEQLFTHVAPVLADEVRLGAEEEGRSVSDLIRRLLLEWAERRFADRLNEAA